MVSKLALGGVLERTQPHLMISSFFRDDSLVLSVAKDRRQFGRVSQLTQLFTAESQSSAGFPMVAEAKVPTFTPNHGEWTP